MLLLHFSVSNPIRPGFWAFTRVSWSLPFHFNLFLFQFRLFYELYYCGSRTLVLDMIAIQYIIVHSVLTSLNKVLQYLRFSIWLEEHFHTAFVSCSPSRICLLELLNNKTVFWESQSFLCFPEFWYPIFSSLKYFVWFSLQFSWSINQQSLFYFLSILGWNLQRADMNT